jgi:hypothetical protein
MAIRWARKIGRFAASASAEFPREPQAGFIEKSHALAGRRE